MEDQYGRNRYSDQWEYHSANSGSQMSIASSPKFRNSTLKRQRTIVCLGAKGVGKSSTLQQYCGEEFSETYMPTIEFTYRKETTWMGEPIDIAIRDTRGQDDTSAFQLRHGAGVHGYMIMYSVAWRRSVEIAKYIHDTLLTNLMGASVDIPMILVGNKCDLEAERQVSYQEGKTLAAEWGCPFIEVSAKTNTKIEEAFNVLLGRIYRGEFGTPEQERLCSCAVLCNAGTKLTHAQQLNFIYMFKWALWFILIVGMVTFVAGLLFGIHTKYKNDVMHLYIGVGVLSVIVAVVGLWGATKLSPNKMKLCTALLVLLSVVHIITIIIALTDEAYVGWMKRGGTVVVAIASIVDVVVQILAAVLAVGVYRIAAETFQHSAGYALFTDNSNAHLMHRTWSNEGGRRLGAGASYA